MQRPQPSGSGDVAGHAQHRAFRPPTLDLNQCALWQGEEHIELRPKAFDVLRYLIEHWGRLVCKQELIKAVWPGC